jgi:unsaturated rhamnogalacturonyl hydrolase
VLADPSNVSLDFEPKPPQGGDPYCQARWCWSDAIFMAPPAWVALSKVTRRQALPGPCRQRVLGDHRLSLRQDRPPLFPRQPLHPTRSDAGAKIFWGRGNGWAFAGIARILQDLPADHPSRPRYEAIFKQMAAKIVTLQGEEGYWPVSLLEPQKTPETSGTGFFVYGLAWGVNHGLLPRAKYGPGDRQGLEPPWTAAIEPDGRWAGCSAWAPRPTRWAATTPSCTASARSCWRPARCRKLAASQGPTTR